MGNGYLTKRAGKIKTGKTGGTEEEEGSVSSYYLDHISFNYCVSLVIFVSLLEKDSYEF